MKRIIYVFAGGPIRDLEFVRQCMASNPPVDVICADGGARHAMSLGMVPRMIVGDMDSIRPAVEHHFHQMGVPFLKSPRRKNETDTELALEQALLLAPDKIWIWGGLGLRLDHTLANLSLLLRGRHYRTDIRLVDEWCEVFLVKHGAVIEGNPGQTISFYPMAGTVSGITLKGFEYPLHDGTMTLENPYGISNRLMEHRALVSIAEGFLLAILYHKAQTFPEGDEAS